VFDSSIAIEPPFLPFAGHYLPYVPPSMMKKTDLFKLVHSGSWPANQPQPSVDNIAAVPEPEEEHGQTFWREMN